MTDGAWVLGQVAAMGFTVGLVVGALRRVLI